MRIAISSETTIDLPKELLKEYQIFTTPFTVLLGDKVILDGEIDVKEIFDYVDRTRILPKTSAVNEYQYKEHFSKLLENHDAIIHFSLSSEMSAAYNNAVSASKDFNNVYVIDSRSLSTGIALEAIYASQLANKGISAEDIVARVEERIPSVQASFVVNTLSYLHKGGRCSALARFGGAILRLKPQILVKDGKMIPGKKFIGRSVGCVSGYCDETLDQFDSPDKSLVFITHSNATPEMVAIAREKLEERGFKKIIETRAGATICSHCGPKTLGILFINDGGVED